MIRLPMGVTLRHIKEAALSCLYGPLMQRTFWQT
jgi:hypothetical protein